jgi:hypothetical protein
MTIQAYAATMTLSFHDTAPGGPYRRAFCPDDGGEWLVWRLSAAEMEALRAPRSVVRDWLIFLGPKGETRRLASFPADWPTISDAELAELAEKATSFGDVSDSLERQQDD